MHLIIKLTCSLGILLFWNSSFALPTYFVGSTNFPPGAGANEFYSKRTDFQATALSNSTTLKLESFEDAIPSTNVINFATGFTATLEF